MLPMIVLVVLVLCGFSFAPAAAHAVDCGDIVPLGLTVPASAVAGSRVAVDVISYTGGTAAILSSADASGPLGQQAFSAQQTDSTTTLYSVAMGHSATTVAITWKNLDDSICSVSKVIAVTAGRPPTFTLHSETPEKYASVTIKGACSGIRSIPIAVVLQSRTIKRIIKRATPCAQWTGDGNLPRLRIKKSDYDTEAYLQFNALGTGDAYREWSMTILANGKRVLKRTMVVSVNHFASRRVYQSTDDFVNYCINENRNVYSANHRLYCTVPATTQRLVSFFKP